MYTYCELLLLLRLLIFMLLSLSSSSSLSFYYNDGDGCTTFFPNAITNPSCFRFCCVVVVVVVVLLVCVVVPLRLLLLLLLLLLFHFDTVRIGHTKRRRHNFLVRMMMDHHNWCLLFKTYVYIIVNAIIYYV